MNWLHLFAYAFGGAFLVNAWPHFIAGVQGRAFQTPFARPPGKGYSSSQANLLWGMANFVVAYLLLVRVGNFDVHDDAHALAVLLGGLAIGLPLAKAFGDIHGGTRPPQA